MSMAQTLIINLELLLSTTLSLTCIGLSLTYRNEALSIVHLRKYIAFQYLKIISKLHRKYYEKKPPIK